MSFAKAKGMGRKMISAEQAKGVVWDLLLDEEERESLHRVCTAVPSVLLGYLAWPYPLRC